VTDWLVTDKFVTKFFYIKLTLSSHWHQRQHKVICKCCLNWKGDNSPSGSATSSSSSISWSSSRDLCDGIDMAGDLDLLSSTARRVSSNLVLYWLRNDALLLADDSRSVSGDSGLGVGGCGMGEVWVYKKIQDTV
jgi:hypothetical protein